jgi:hypothetical protein
MYLVQTLFKFQKERELECVWSSMLKNFKGSLKIKGKVLIFLNVWSNMSQPRAFDRNHSQAFLIW